jgi:SNF2 family DNA or RNA helicase
MASLSYWRSWTGLRSDVTQGSVVYDPRNRRWVVECAPHISMRLKRVFSKLSNRSIGRHFISDTAENARDLEWFVQRYPLHVAEPDRLKARAIEHRDQEQLVQTIGADGYVPPEFKLAAPARDYQRTAAAMCLARGGLLLADDVGVGKTANAICILTDPRTLPAIVVTLTHLPRQWKAELARFAPSLRAHIINKSKPYPIHDRPDVVIINYHKLSGWAQTFATAAKSVIFDEVQELRKQNSDKYKAAVHLAGCCDFRMGLLATPIYNYGGEFYNVLNALFPGELGNAEEFGIEWCGGSTGEKAKITNPKALGTYLRDNGFMLRRTRADVGRELPGLQVIPHHVESDPEYLNRVKSSCVELARLILSSDRTERGAKMHASEELSNRLRQATGIAKAPYVAAFVRLLIENGEKVVL